MGRLTHGNRIHVVVIYPSCVEVQRVSFGVFHFLLRPLGFYLASGIMAELFRIRNGTWTLLANQLTQGKSKVCFNSVLYNTF